MRENRERGRIPALPALLLLALLLLLVGAASPVRAASGSVYTCAVTPCYAHPVTGEIEDSGGSSSYATGQGMVEGTIYTTGLLELTDTGEYYLTFKMSLIDYTTNQSFTVQNVGDSSWSSTGMAVTGTGTDSNGTTADVCIEVPSENCIVRCSMYVTPMGRDVIFYFYPSSYEAGNTSGLTATIVTEASTAGAASETAATTTAAANTEAAGASAETEAAAETETAETTAESAAESESTDAGTEAEATVSADAELGSAQGLSLSTAEETAASSEEAGTSGGMTAAELAAAIVIAGLILLCAVAAVVIYCRKNWRRWGGDDDDDEE